jgi:hypothetical protein
LWSASSDLGQNRRPQAKLVPNSPVDRALVLGRVGLGVRRLDEGQMRDLASFKKRALLFGYTVPVNDGDEMLRPGESLVDDPAIAAHVCLRRMKRCVLYS